MLKVDLTNWWTNWVSTQYALEGAKTNSVPNQTEQCPDECLNKCLDISGLSFGEKATEQQLSFQVPSSPFICSALSISSAVQAYRVKQRTPSKHLSIRYLCNFLLTSEVKVDCLFLGLELF